MWAVTSTCSLRTFIGVDGKSPQMFNWNIVILIEMCLFYQLNSQASISPLKPNILHNLLFCSLLKIQSITFTALFSLPLMEKNNEYWMFAQLNVTFVRGAF